MAGKFEWTQFKDVDIQDSFFDSLKSDYDEFPQWFERKSVELKQALVFRDEEGIGAFLYLKEENESLELKDRVLPAIPRLKIGTLKLAERFRGQRLGEGAIGVALWKWQESELDEIYVTVFDRHDTLTNLFSIFGFVRIGMNIRGESVYLKRKQNLDYSNPKKAFPFINPNFNKACILPINDIYHDKLLPYSELYGNNGREIEEITAGNGVTKVFIASPYTNMSYQVNDPLFVYRIYTGTEGKKTYKSVITSYACITRTKVIKSNRQFSVSLENFLKLVGNKSVFTDDELVNMYNTKANLVILEFVYNGYFGKGNNVNHNTLKKSGLFESHPYNIKYNREQFKKILELGRVESRRVFNE